MTVMQKIALGVLLFLFTLGFVTGCSVKWAWGQDSHGMYHEDYYQHWRQESGASCCNKRVEHESGLVTGDCRRANARIRQDGRFEVEIDGKWILVPERAVRPYQAPDLGAHVCHQGEYILCFVFTPGI